MKNFFIAVFLVFVSLSFSACSKSAMLLPNPWVECQDNLEKAKKVAGFEFPLLLSNYQVRAMKDMIEIIFPLDEYRSVIVRKSENVNGDDISGVYNNYPVNKEISLKNGVLMNIRGDNNKIYVMNMSASSGYYSAFCDKGMSLKEIEGIYKVISEAESPKIPDYID